MYCSINSTATKEGFIRSIHNHIDIDFCNIAFLKLNLSHYKGLFLIFNEYKQNSGEQFKCAIIKLFPNKYHDHCQLLWQGLRNGLVHANTPKSQIGLFSKNDEIYYKILYEQHPVFDKKEDKLIIGVEYFYDDFVEACKKILEMEFSADKMNKPLLNTPSK